MSNRIIPAALAIKSMRDSGYTNTAKALAEIIDNSLQWGSKDVDVILVEQPHVRVNTTYRIHKIGVLDNGVGMTKSTLQKALQFGGGENEKLDAKTIGKFGFGLPNSSISQARRVEVWTWQDGNSAIYSYLDIDEITSSGLDLVPEPLVKPLPKDMFLSEHNIGSSGTLVVWSNLDKVLWKTGKSIINNAEFEVGRMYRYFLNANERRITATVYQSDKPDAVQKHRLMANDPLYLMQGTSVKELTDGIGGVEDPLFVEFRKKVFDIKYNDVVSEVTVTASIAKESTRKGKIAGSRAYGKHAAKNVGVSIVRSNRELKLDKAWTNSHDTRERWWGVEVSFGPHLDDVFGVTNNKQEAVHFSEFAKEPLENIFMDEGVSQHEYIESLKADDDPKAHLIEIVGHVQNVIIQMRERIKAQAKQLEGDSGRASRHPEDNPEARATASTRKRSEAGFAGESDSFNGTQKETEEELKKVLEEVNIADVETIASMIANSSDKYKFITAALSDSSYFFSVSPTAGKLIIKLNSNHPAYDGLLEVLDGDDNEGNAEERLVMARNGLKLLLMSWARFEDERSGQSKRIIRENRTDWGRVAWSFFDPD